MKLKFVRLFVTFIFILSLFSSAMQVNAMNTGFSTEKLTEKEQNTVLSNISISLLTAEPPKRSISCFDVNDKGMIAIGRDDRFGNKEICIYSSDGTFLYGYTFNTMGTFGVEWDNEHLNLYYVRSDIIISLDSKGNILDIKKAKNTMENNTYSNDLLYSTSCVIGDTKYLIRNDMGILNLIAVSYSQIVAIDTDGEERIIYDMNSTQLLNTVKWLILIFIFVSICVTGVIWELVKLNRKSKNI